MTRRDFFRWLRATPVVLPVLATQAMKPDGVGIDGKTMYLGGRKVLEQLDDGSLAIGETRNIVLMSPNHVVEVRADAALHLKNTDFYL